jgi:eukaryotic-like serine/threonine-protein kinase
MGAVYAVTHNGFGKRAALKLCHDSILSADYTAQTFLREARIVHLIDHPGVCDVFATGTFGGRPYLAMERLYGETLGCRLERGPLSRHEAFDVLIELCQILAAAHHAGVVHRDLKLDNVFVLDPSSGAGRRVKLVDWGVARVLCEDDPMHGMIVGTLTYVAPEQARGDDITPAADIYSLGVLAYQLLLGRPPFRADSDLGMIQHHLRSEPPSPMRWWPDIPDQLEALLVGMLAKHPERRPSLEEIEDVLSAARMPAPPHRPRRDRLAFDVLGRPILDLVSEYRMLGVSITIACAIGVLASILSA